MRAWPALLLILLMTCGAFAQEVDAQAVAETPRKFYQAVNAKDYPAAWSLLTEASKARLSSAIAADAKMEAATVRAMFEGNAPELTAGFWETFRAQTKAEILVQATYTYAGPKNGAMVVKLSEPGGKPEEAMDLIVKDENGYKYGLTETMQY